MAVGPALLYRQGAVLPRRTAGCQRQIGRLRTRCPPSAGSMPRRRRNFWQAAERGAARVRRLGPTCRPEHPARPHGPSHPVLTGHSFRPRRSACRVSGRQVWPEPVRVPPAWRSDEPEARSEVRWSARRKSGLDPSAVVADCGETAAFFANRSRLDPFIFRHERSGPERAGARRRALVAISGRVGWPEMRRCSSPARALRRSGRPESDSTTPIVAFAGRVIVRSGVTR